MLGEPGELPGAVRPLREDRDAVDELVGHPLREPRRVELEEHGGDHHRPVDRDPARVVADQHGPAARRDVLDAVGAHAEVVAVEKREEAQPDREVLPRDAVRIDPVAAERELQP